MFLKLVTSVFILMLVSGSAFADKAKQNCTYLDYDYIPHPDWKVGGNRPRDFRLTIKKNPNFKGSQGGNSEFFFLDTLDSQTQAIQSTVKMAYRCTALGVIHCYLDVKGKPKPSDRIDISIFNDFASGTMKNRVPFALAIPGLLVGTKNTDFAEENIIKKSENIDYMPYFVPEHWVSDKKLRDCTLKAK